MQNHKCGHNYDLVKIEHEALGENPNLTIFQCPMCGENVHELRNNANTS